jgi:hypothetical protein
MSFAMKRQIAHNVEGIAAAFFYINIKLEKKKRCGNTNVSGRHIFIYSCWGA